MPIAASATKTPSGAAKARWLGALSCLGAIVSSGEVQAMRCGTRLIAPGDHESKLLEFCGEPMSVQSRYGHRLYLGDTRRGFVPGFFEEVVVEEWTYNFGPTRLMRVVRIEDGFVAEITRLGYGFTPSD